MRIVRGIKKAGDKEVESIEVETAEYFRYKYWVTLGIRRGWKREQSGPCEP